MPTPLLFSRARGRKKQNERQKAEKQVRMAEMIKFISETGATTLRPVAEHLGVSMVTVHRYKKELAQMNLCPHCHQPMPAKSTPPPIKNNE